MNNPLLNDMQHKVIVPFIVGALLVGGGSFYGGMAYAKGKPMVRNGARQQGAGAPFAAGQGFRGAVQGANAGGFTTGEVVSKDANSLTLKLRDGGSKIVFYSSSTIVGKMTSGSMEDVTQGMEIAITGTAGQDGSVAASAVQIRPPGQMPVVPVK